ncbi:chorismate mutase/prephenate dehydratase related protein [Thermoplasma acidophilum]|uniref:Chorismate mutase/prephenate dehydratase related protein n=1 Tax=Thermoplasma acidophilum (strain ATCC 25905 / DSM 1728 / JCM 9062 / NBRC 15155 / AMRC-C165) TaxID=273075 RepID=Q9HJQ2_THEAC|nr:chorismate mutase/prephenate dehydratase related protein [Thermoplasma acidophilum]
MHVQAKFSNNLNIFEYSIVIRKIFYLGPPGSFSQEAAEIFGSDLVPVRSISEIFHKISVTGDYGIVPIENSIEGPVNETLDGLFRHEDIYIVDHVEIPIEIFLASNCDTENIRRIYSHPHAIAEAGDYLERTENIEVIRTSSTSEAAKLASMDEAGAALCSMKAAQHYGLANTVKIESKSRNITRFILIGRERNVEGSRHIILCVIPDRPGSLHSLIGVLASRGINMNMIYSRPLRDTIWKYYFYIEFSGKLDEDLLLTMGKQSLRILYKGSFKCCR